ncbi:MAG: rhodanese-like domain-containing protein [Nitrospirota bacterium]
MLRRRIAGFSLAAALVISCIAGQTVAQEKAGTPAASPPARPTMAKICANCHTAQTGSLRGNFDSVAYKTQSLQIKIDDATEILRFDKAALKVENVKGENSEEPLRDIAKGKEVRIEYTEKDGRKFATLVVAKPPIKISPEKMVSTADVEKLVAMGPEKGKYTLIDARPPMKALEGTIPTAINIPFVAFEKMVDKLPKEKDALIIYFCQGVT